jgi:Na+/melibiose symporter-like transporter
MNTVEELSQSGRLIRSFDSSKILLLCFCSFGNHFARHALTIIVVYLVENGSLTSFGLGLLFSIISLPSMFLPLLVGALVDHTQHIFLIGGILLLLSVFSEGIFFVSLRVNSFPLQLFSQFLFGCGSTSFTTIQRTMISYYLKVPNFTVSFII